MSKLSVNFNPSAEYATRELALVQRRLDKNSERLASGQKINSAQDDPAGFATRERMRAAVAVFQKGIENLQNGISVVQIADGTIGTVIDLLGRMKELAILSASSNVGAKERANLQVEFLQIGAEIDRLATDTEFNGHKLLDGSLRDRGLRIHYGMGNDPDSDYFLLQFEGITLDNLGLTTTNLTSQTEAQTAIDNIDQAARFLNTRLAQVGAYQNRLEAMQGNLAIGLENLRASESAISDADVAGLTVELTRDQILQQAAMAALSQANDLSSEAVSLLLRR